MKNGGWEGKLWSADPWTWHGYCIYQFSQQLWLSARHLHTSKPIPVLIREGFSKPLRRSFRQLVVTKGGRGFFSSLGMWSLIRCPHLSGWPHIVHRCIVLVGHTWLLIIKINMMIMKTWGWERDEVVSSGTLEGVNGGGVNMTKMHCIWV